MKEKDWEPWLFSQEELSPDQRKTLERALAASHDLRLQATALRQVERRLQSSGMMAPPPGFVNRWRTHLALRRRRRAQRQTWGFLGLAFSGATLLASILGHRALSLLATPADLAVRGITRLIQTRTMVEVSWNFMGAVVDSLPDPLPILGGVYLILLLGWLSALWLFAVYRYAYQDLREGVTP